MLVQNFRLNDIFWVFFSCVNEVKKEKKSIVVVIFDCLSSICQVDEFETDAK